MTKRHKWIHCPVCQHRMFLDLSGGFEIEIKCPSCKNIIYLTENEWRVKENEERKSKRLGRDPGSK